MCCLNEGSQIEGKGLCLESTASQKNGDTLGDSHTVLAHNPAPPSTGGLRLARLTFLRSSEENKPRGQLGTESAGW